MKFKSIIKGKMLKNEHFLALKVSNAVLIALINVKKATFVGMFYIYEQDKYHAQLR